MECWCVFLISSGSIRDNHEKAILILLLPPVRIESIWTQFPVKQFPKTAKKSSGETIAQPKDAKKDVKYIKTHEKTKYYFDDSFT
jgi:hypothetical protein